MSAHTSDGEWNVAEMTGVNPRITGGPLQVIRAGDDVVLAFVCPWLDTEAEAKEAAANARLFAAAPALLEALTFAARFFDQLTPADAERMRAVITKATGSPA